MAQYFPFARKWPPSSSLSPTLTDTLTAFDPPFPLVHLLVSEGEGRREEVILSSCPFVEEEEEEGISFSSLFLAELAGHFKDSDNKFIL